LSRIGSSAASKGPFISAISYVQEEPGVAGVVDLLSAHREDDAGGVSERLAVGAVDPWCAIVSFDVAERKLPPPADVERMSVDAVLPNHPTIS